MMELIFLKPVFQEKIWGGTRLRHLFDDEIPSEMTGEAWVISAHPHGVSSIASPTKYHGLPLADFYAQHPHYFGPNPESVFPLLVKFIDAQDNLSIQVHPDDDYAKQHEGELGKAECWYILEATPGAQIVYGHQAKNLEKFVVAVNEGRWEELLVIGCMIMTVKIFKASSEIYIFVSDHSTSRQSMEQKLCRP